MPLSRADVLLGKTEEEPEAAPTGSSRADQLLASDPQPASSAPKYDRVTKMPKEKLYSGGTVSDIFDFLGSVLLTYPTTAGAVALTKGENPAKAAGKTLLAGFGIGEADRPSYEEALEEIGMKPGAVRTGLGLTLDIVVDPAWIVTPASIMGKLNKIRSVEQFTTSLKKGAESTRLGRFATRNLVFPLDRAGVSPATREAYDTMRVAKGTLEARADKLAKTIQKESQSFRNFLTEMAEAETTAERAAIRAAGKPLGIDGTKLSAVYDEAIVLQSDLIWRTAQAATRSTSGAKDLMVREFQDKLTGIMQKRAELSKLTRPGRPPKNFDSFLDGITEEGFKVAHAVSKAGARVAKLEFFQELATSAVTKEMPGYVRINKNIGRFGALAGKWVPEPLADMANLLAREPTKWEKKIAGVLSLWKAGKTVLNIGAHPRQFFGNMVLSTATGPMPFHRLPGSMVAGARALAGHGDKAVLEAVELLKIRGGTFNETEIRKLAEAVNVGSSRGIFSTIKKTLAGGADRAANLYQFWDRWAKAGMASYAISKGATPKAAVAMAEAALFDYARVPRLVELARAKGIVPFASFAYFASRASAKALWSRPASIGRVADALHAVERTNPDLAEQKGQLPPWMKEMGNVVLPITDAHGRKLSWNAGYLLPFQSFVSLAEGGRLPSVGSLPQQAVANVPIANLLVELVANRSTFTGREIVKPAELVGSTEEKTRVWGRRIIDYVYKLALPSWAPSIVPFVQHPSEQLTTGGYTWQNAEDAIMQRPDFFGKAKGTKSDWWQVVMAEGLGFRTRPIDIEGERKRRANEYKDRQRFVTTKMHRVSDDTSLSIEEKQRLMADLQKDLLAVHQDWVLSQGGDLDEED